MSRTYRHRNLPTLEGYPSKWVDSAGIHFWIEQRARDTSHFAHFINHLPCLHQDGPEDFKKVHTDCLWQYKPLYWSYWGLPFKGFDLWVPPIGRNRCHPWVRLSKRYGSQKVRSEVLRRGRRSARRKSNVLLHDLERTNGNWEDCEDFFPEMKYEANPRDWY